RRSPAFAPSVPRRGCLLILNIISVFQRDIDSAGFGHVFGTGLPGPGRSGSQGLIENVRHVQLKSFKALAGKGHTPPEHVTGRQVRTGVDTELDGFVVRVREPELPHAEAPVEAALRYRVPFPGRR